MGHGKVFTVYLKRRIWALGKSATDCRRMGFRVKSGNRSLTIKQVFRDELLGGDFLASMSEKEYKLFQKYLSVKYKAHSITL